MMAKNTAKTSKKTSPPPATKDIAKRPSQSVAPITNGHAAEDEDLAQYAGAGFEEATTESYALPRLVVLQDLSPQVKQRMAGYVEGAKPGMIFNTVTKELFTSLIVIPCYYSQKMIEWIPRRNAREQSGGGKGPVAVHPYDTPLARQVTRDGSRNILPNGHELNDTKEHYVLYLRDDGTTGQAVIAMTSTQIKVSRAWMTQARSERIASRDGQLREAPLFACSYRLDTEEEANEQGSWYSWTVQKQGRVSPDLLAECAAFQSYMKSGRARVNYEEDDHSTSNGTPPRDLDEEEEIDA